MTVFRSMAHLNGAYGFPVGYNCELHATFENLHAMLSNGNEEASETS